MATSRTISVRNVEHRAATALGRAGGFTLIEILIALTIAVALMALVSPPLVRWVGEYRFRETLSQVEATMVRVRAGAQRSGNAVEVLARNSGDTVRLFGREIDLGSGPSASEGESRTQSPPVEQFVFEFPAGFSVGEPQIEAAPATSESEGMAPPPELAEERGVPQTGAEDAGAVIVIFLPDGSASRGSSGVVSDRSGRSARLKVNTWTGRVELLAEPTPAISSGPARRPVRGRRVRRHGPRRARAALLLETMVALAIFVAGGLAVLALVNRAAASMALARDYRGAADLARSAMARIEAGIATPQTLNGPVAAWDPGDDTGENGGEIGSGFADAPTPVSGWELEISTEPSAFEGLTLVSVKALRRVSETSENTRASYTLRQLVRLGGAGSESVGDLDPLSEKIGPTRTPAPAEGQQERSGR